MGRTKRKRERWEVELAARRTRAVEMRKRGESVAAIARASKMSESGVYKLLRRAKNKNVAFDRPRSGRPKKVTAKIVQRVKRALTSGKARSISTTRRCLATKNINLSQTSTYRAIKRTGLKAYGPADKPELTDERKQARLAFCKRMIQEDANDHQRIVFHDEKHFTLNSGRVQYVWQSPDDPKPRHRTKTHPLSIYVSGAISWWGKTRLVFHPPGKKVDADHYLLTLQKHHIPDIDALFEHGDFLWMQDGARFHTAHKVTDWLDNRPIERITDWPACSPDLNPIENVWGMMVQRMGEGPHKTEAGLRRAVTRAWDSISVEDLKGLYESLPTRFQQVIDREGDTCDY